MPLFSLPIDTECTLTSFTGRTQKHGPEDVPAVSFRLLLKGVSNELLDKFSSTIRHVAYEAVEGQEELPGVEPSTPILRSKDLKSWNPDTCLEGWSLVLARGISDATALQMRSCKLDDFRFVFYEGGHVDCDFRVGTADIDEEGAGMLWGRQKRKVFVGIEAPAEPMPAIDGTKDLPGFGGGSGYVDEDTGPLFPDLGDEDPEQTPEGALAQALGQDGDD